MAGTRAHCLAMGMLCRGLLLIPFPASLKNRSSNRQREGNFGTARSPRNGRAQPNCSPRVKVLSGAIACWILHRRKTSLASCRVRPRRRDSADALTLGYVPGSTIWATADHGSKRFATAPKLDKSKFVDCVCNPVEISIGLTPRVCERRGSSRSDDEGTTRQKA